MQNKGKFSSHWRKSKTNFFIFFFLLMIQKVQGTRNEIKPDYHYGLSLFMWKLNNNPNQIKFWCLNPNQNENKNTRKWCNLCSLTHCKKTNFEKMTLKWCWKKWAQNDVKKCPPKRCQKNDSQIMSKKWPQNDVEKKPKWCKKIWPPKWCKKNKKKQKMMLKKRMTPKWC